MEDLKDLSKYYEDIRIVFLDLKSALGFYNYEKNTIVLDSKIKDKNLLKFILLHELGHAKDKKLFNDITIQYYNIGLYCVEIISIYYMLISSLILWFVKEYIDTYINFVLIGIFTLVLLGSFYLITELRADIFAYKICKKENIKLNLINLKSVFSILTYLLFILIFLFIKFFIK